MLVVEGSTPDAATIIEVPAAPGFEAATAGDEQVKLQWNAPEDDGGADITGYKIEQSNTSAEEGWTEVVANTRSTATKRTITDLAQGTQYWLRVSAINSAGAGEPSGVLTATTPAPAGAPSGLAAEPGEVEVKTDFEITPAEEPEEGIQKGMTNP